MFGLSKIQYSPIAVDFGADSVKLLQVTLTDPPQFVAGACAEVPESMRSDPAQRMAFFQQAIPLMLKSHPFKGRRAILSLPGFHMLVQQIQCAHGDDAELLTQIELHLRQRMNIEPARLVVRHFVAGQTSRDGTPKDEVICMAAAREGVMSMMDLAKRCRLDVVGMQCEQSAILKAFAHLYRRASDSQRTTCFIDIGAATTKVAIAHGTQLVFAKNIHSAGDHVTRQVAMRQSIGFSEAKKLRAAQCAMEKQRMAEPRDTVPDADVAVIDRRCGGVSPVEVQSAPAGALAVALAVAPAQTQRVAGQPFRPTSNKPDAEADPLDCLIDELQLSVRYHQGTFPGRSIEKLVFLGGEANHLASCQRIARALRIGAQLGDPLARLSRSGAPTGPGAVDLRQPQPGWAVPLGLCLSQPDA